jgi:hypothetical protein
MTRLQLHLDDVGDARGGPLDHQLRVALKELRSVKAAAAERIKAMKSLR